MKKAIFTIAIGNDNPMYKAALESFKHYAQKVEADLIVTDSPRFDIKIENPKYLAHPAWSEKCRIGELLEEYDRVLYLDADMLITPDARNVFDVYSDLETVYMLDEGKETCRKAVLDDVFQALGTLEDWPKHGELLTYYNVGMILISRQCPLFQYACFNELQDVSHKIKYYEQTYFNYLIQKHNIKNECIAPEFNRMDLFGQEGYLESDFIHYANKGYSPSGRRRELQYVADFCKFYQSHLPAGRLSELKQEAWAFFLDKVYKRYKLPNPLLKLICNSFVSKPV
ncbi:glycosyltransferase family 8 protein [Alteromonas sp. a30]|uniref:glycosyltransferase family 8 protein n=1 Tax=Alteromonas sp. a30 TaxID=2730917 RepID=UPI00227FC5CF|nr:glycosyltransferase family 8 protein [Alteromonas sp. a30]MCY7295433.1 glycosyltransferase family 8 protein [Alteromonas sp. a30]